MNVSFDCESHAGLVAKIRRSLTVYRSRRRRLEGVVVTRRRELCVCINAWPSAYARPIGASASVPVDEKDASAENIAAGHLATCNQYLKHRNRRLNILSANYHVIILGVRVEVGY